MHDSSLVSGCIGNLGPVVEVDMLIKVDGSALGKTKWHEYAVRFFFGGVITAITGLIAEHFGPTLGGLFLAFPAIFPASATLIEKHEKEKKEKHGFNGSDRARKAASIDAAGAAIGNSGLFVFAWLCWKFLPHHSAPVVLCGATLVWLSVSITSWQVRKRL